MPQNYRQIIVSQSNVKTYFVTETSTLRPQRDLMSASMQDNDK